MRFSMLSYLSKIIKLRYNFEKLIQIALLYIIPPFTDKQFSSLISYAQNVCCDGENYSAFKIKIQKIINYFSFRSHSAAVHVCEAAKNIKIVRKTPSECVLNPKSLKKSGRINLLAGVSRWCVEMLSRKNENLWFEFLSSFGNINIFLIFLLLLLRSRMNYRRLMISCCFSYIKFRHS